MKYLNNMVKEISCVFEENNMEMNIKIGVNAIVKSWSRYLLLNF